MLGNVRWGWAILFFILGGFLGQRLAHLHPVGSVKNANS
jgi:hypothetical protein